MWVPACYSLHVVAKGQFGGVLFFNHMGSGGLIELTSFKQGSLYSLSCLKYEVYISSSNGTNLYSFKQLLG